MSFGNFLYQVEGIGALPDASLYTDKYWCVLTGNSQYQGATYKSDGTNWIYTDGCVTYGPGTPYATMNDLPENCAFLAPNGGVYLKRGEVIVPVSADLLYNEDAVVYEGEQIVVDVVDFIILLNKDGSVILNKDGSVILNKR
jgi:hypothetical protein